MTEHTVGENTVVEEPVVENTVVEEPVVEDTVVEDTVEPPVTDVYETLYDALEDACIHRGDARMVIKDWCEAVGVCPTKFKLDTACLMLICKLR